MRLHLDTTQRFASGFAIAATLDLDLAPGSITVLFGPSGAGKTTMLRHIAGLERPDAGTIRCDSETWFDAANRVWRPPQDRRLGVVFQEPTLFPHMSVLDNVHYGVRAAADAPPGAGISPAAAEIVAALEIGRLQIRPARQLSGGEAQRVALARALIRAPRLLLLDEPFVSLDAPARAIVRRDVRRLLHRLGTPAILVTHDRVEAMSLGDRIVVALGGRVRQVGSVEEVFSHPVDVEVAAAVGVETALPGRVTERENGLLTVAIDGAQIHVAERAGIGLGSAVYACIRAEDVTIETDVSASHSSTRNRLAARIVSIAGEGPVDRVALDCGFPLDALITRQARQELNLSPGAQVTAAIKATSVHLVSRA